MDESTATQLITMARRRVGVTQACYAEAAGTSRSRLSTYESGAVDPTVATLERILQPARLSLVAVPALTAEDRRSLAFGEAIAAHLRSERATEIMAGARAALDRMRHADDEAGGHASPLLTIWGALLDLGPGTCAGVLAGARNSRGSCAAAARSADVSRAA